MSGDVEDAAFPDYTIVINTQPADTSANTTERKKRMKKYKDILETKKAMGKIKPKVTKKPVRKTKPKSKW